MTKIQTILSLVLFLVIIFIINMIFGNSISETFRGGGGGGGGRLGGGGLGRVGLGGAGLGRVGLGRGGLGLGLGGEALRDRLELNNNYGIVTDEVPIYYYDDQSDDEPLFFNLFKRF